MPRRGITFERYDVPNANLGSVRFPTPSPDTTVSDAIGLGGKAVSTIGEGLAKALRAKEDLAQKVLIGERYFQASTEMDEQRAAIELNPESRQKAREIYAKWEADRMATWTRGLSDEGKAAFEEKLREKRISGAHAARQIEFKDLQDRTDKSLWMFGKRYVETFVRSGPELTEYEPAAGSGNKRTTLSESEEQAFQTWYRGVAKKSGVNADPDDPRHRYDWRGAFKAGAEGAVDPSDGKYHFPSEYKDDDHPNRFVDGKDTKNGGTLRRKETKEFRDLKEEMGNAVAAKAKDRRQAAKELAEYDQEAAATKAHAMMNSGDPTKLQRLLDLHAQEEQRPGSTFLSLVDPARREALHKQAKEAEHVQFTRLRTARTDAREALERSRTEQVKEYERRLDTKLANQQLEDADVEEGKRFGLLDDDKARFYRTRAEKQRTGEEGANDPTTFRRLAPRVDDPLTDPKKLLGEIEEAYAGQRLNWETVGPWRTRLNSRVEAEKHRGADKEESRLEKERTEVRGAIEVLTHTRSTTEKFDQQANNLKLSLYDELLRLPGNESAKVWWEKNKVEFYGRMRSRAQQVIKAERDAMLMESRVAVTDADIARNKAQYEKKFGAAWQDAMMRDLDRLDIVNRLQEEIELKRPDGGNQPGPKPAAAAPGAPPKSSGPLQPRRN